MDDPAAKANALAERALAKNRERRKVAAAEAEARAIEVEKKREEFRAAMPEIAGVVDGFKSVFGEGVRVLAAAENGRCVANRKACERIGVDVRAYEDFAKR